MQSIDRWKGRVALVTGASAGIGRAVAEQLADAGLKVALTARRAERLEALAARIRERGGEALALPADARDEAALLDVFARIRAEWGGVDVMINNAGLGRMDSLCDGETAAWREMFEVNVLALSICTREAIGDMRARGDAGQIIHISSMAGHRVPGDSGGFYAATKHAVKGLTEALRRELRAADSAIRVCAISPGMVETEFAEVMGGPDIVEEAYGRFPCLQPHDVADAVLFALTRPPHSQIHDILLRPTRQPS